MEYVSLSHSCRSFGSLSAWLNARLTGGFGASAVYSPHAMVQITNAEGQVEATRDRAALRGKIELPVYLLKLEVVNAAKTLQASW